MIRRIYIDNFKCFNNFELKLPENFLLLGRNGSGKSSIIDVVGRIRNVIVLGNPVGTIFDKHSTCRWRSEKILRQIFELDVEDVHGELWHYRLQVRHDLDVDSSVIELESVKHLSQVTYELTDSKVRLFNASRDPSSSIEVDPSRSLLTWFSGIKSNPNRDFLNAISNFWSFQPNPWIMSGVSEKAEDFLLGNGSNFASWFRYQLETNPTLIVNDLFADLKDVIEGFDSLRLEALPEGKRSLLARFHANHSNSGNGSASGIFEAAFWELSDGQRVAIMLYAILRVLPERVSLLIDEPDNFLSLREIQPWILALQDRLAETNGQAMIISHHPEYLNYYAGDRTIRMFRDVNGEVRTEPFTPSAESGLLPSEIVARGWDDDE